MMERDRVTLFFLFGKRRAMVDSLTPNQAKKALESVEKMEDAGWRRAVPGHCFGFWSSGLDRKQEMRTNS